MDRLVRAKIGGGPYRVIRGDVLELTMPTILQVVTAAEPEITGEMAPYVCRVSDNGDVTLPVVGQCKVAGKTLAEIESAITKAYYPEYTVTRPSVFVRVLEYKTAKVSVTGAVNRPGIYSLRSDQMSLVALLMEAEGIIDQGAAFIRIAHADQIGLDNETKTTKTDEEPVERPPRSAMQNPDFSESDIQLAFKQPSPSSTIGRLTIKQDETVLLSEVINIASETERDTLVEKLALRRASVSAAEVNRRLCALAELLKPRAGISTAVGSHVSTDGTLDGFRVPTKLLTPDPNMRITGYSATHQSLVSDVKLNTRDSGKVSGVDDGLLAQREKVHRNLPEESTAEGDTEFAEQIGSNETKEPRSLVLPVKGFNIPFADVALQDGDRVIVERLGEPMITVVGLVNRPGNFPYPPNVEYNLMHALGFAGGLNFSAEPRYATVYRLRTDSTTISATFNVIGIAKSKDPTYALSIRLKPYDVVAVEHTQRTRAMVFWDRAFRFNIGTYIRMEDIFEDD
jgi:protein involved in polysaccharide export with SLBB domain